MAELYHYGMPRRSGRYPWGSGKDPYQSAGGNKRKEYRIFKQERNEYGFDLQSTLAGERKSMKDVQNAIKKVDKTRSKYGDNDPRTTKAVTDMLVSEHRMKQWVKESDRLIRVGQEAYNDAVTRFGDKKLKDIKIIDDAKGRRLTEAFTPSDYLWKYYLGGPLYAGLSAMNDKNYIIKEVNDRINRGE